MEKSLRSEIRRAPEIAGFSAHWTWIWCVFWSPMFYTSVAAVGGPSSVSGLEPLWTVSLSSNVLALWILAVASSRFPSLADSVRIAWCAAALTCFGTLLMSNGVVIFVGSASFGLYVFGSVLTGFGSACVVVLWAETLARMGPVRTIRYFVFAALVGTATYVFLCLMRVAIAQILVALLPVASIACLLRFRAHSMRTRQRPDIICRQGVSKHLIVIAVFFGVSFGLMKGLIAPAGADWIVLRDILNAVAIALAAVAIYLTTSICRLDLDHLTYRVALPFMAAGFLFLPLHEPISVVGTGVYQFGYQYFYIVIWTIWAVLATRTDVPAIRVVSWCMFAIQFGQLVGSGLASFVLMFAADDFDKAMVSSFAVFVILLMSLFVFGRRSANTVWGFIRPMDEEENMSEGDCARVRLARRFELSPRETEVFLLLAKGRNRAFIRDELIIGDETVRSHVGSIYRKAGVHSQQELIDAVDRERENARIDGR